MSSQVFYVELLRNWRNLCASSAPRIDLHMPDLGPWGDIPAPAGPSAKLFEILLSGTNLYTVGFYLDGIHYKDPLSGATPLTVACVNHYWSIVVLLLKRGADATNSIPEPANTEPAHGSETVRDYCIRMMETIRATDASLADELAVALA